MTSATDFATYHEATISIARDFTVIAYNRVVTWERHPSYDTKGSLLLAIDKAIAALDLIDAAARISGTDPYVTGVSLAGLTDLRKAVTDRKSGQREMNLPGYRAVILPRLP